MYHIWYNIIMNKWSYEYYQKIDGKIPVLEYLESIDDKMRAKVFWEIELDKALSYKVDFERREDEEGKYK